MKKMLVADNIEMNKSIIHEIFSSHYEILQTSGSELAFKFLTQYKNSISIILINENIARSFSSDIVKTLTNLRIFENVPVILILDSDSSRMNAVNIDMPFSDVVESPVDPFVIQKRVKNLVELVLNIPDNKKIVSMHDEMRKSILRKLAFEEGLDYEIAYRPKKAAQYGTGIDKILRKKVIKDTDISKYL